MRSLCLLGFFLAAVIHSVILPAEEAVPEAEQQEDLVAVSDDSPLQRLFPRFKGRALVLDINACVVEENQTVYWNESHRIATIPGRPVGIKLVGANIVVTAQFTPYIRHRGLKKLLVAQGQIWMDVPDEGMRYYTSMQTIPLEFGEPVYFFPLGSAKDEGAASIEVTVTLYPYEGNEALEKMREE